MKVPHSTRQALRRRAGDRCEYCGGWVTAAWDRSGNAHHRQPRGIGGSSRPEINALANLVWVHERCHRVIESNRETAYSEGWLVRHPTDPATVAVRTYMGWVLLGDGYAPCPNELDTPADQCHSEQDSSNRESA